jgi:hypothetical protein
MAASWSPQDYVAQTGDEYAPGTDAQVGRTPHHVAAAQALAARPAPPPPSVISEMLH